MGCYKLKTWYYSEQINKQKLKKTTEFAIWYTQKAGRATTEFGESSDTTE